MLRYTKDLGEGPGETRSQTGALCWRMYRRRVEVLLITSRDTGRWVIPKGWPKDGMTAAEAAASEAWEEAGVRGQIVDEPVGLFTYDKHRFGKPPLPCAVSVFALRVTGLANQFPERHERHRKWFPAAKAARNVDEAELRTLLLALDSDPDSLNNAMGKVGAYLDKIS